MGMKGNLRVTSPFRKGGRGGFERNLIPTLAKGMKGNLRVISPFSNGDEGRVEGSFPPLEKGGEGGFENFYKHQVE
jgi:hypothetical protein